MAVLHWVFILISAPMILALIIWLCAAMYMRQRWLVFECALCALTYALLWTGVSMCDSDHRHGRQASRRTMTVFVAAGTTGAAFLMIGWFTSKRERWDLPPRDTFPHV